MPQLTGGSQAFGLSTSYSPNSSHILLGDAEQRRIWTLGIEYSRLLVAGRNLRLDYSGSICPVYEETDPTLDGTIFTFNGQPIITPITPIRVTLMTSGPVGTISIGNSTKIPVYAIYGRRNTYGALIAPLSAHLIARPGARIQPSASIELGFVVTARDVPIELSDNFNFMFAFGPGLELFPHGRTSWRLEYLYRHTSNAGEGFQNPGIDQGVIRVTLRLHP
jgi:hypothetical protein